MPHKESDFDKLPPTIIHGQPPLDDSWVEKVPLDFGNYTRLAELGKGGFGIVYHVRHRSLGFDRALKVLDPRIAAETGEKQRFLREARVLAGLYHVPQVVHIHEVSTEEDPWNWLLMELIPGLPLAENFNAVSAAHCLEWFRQTSAAGEGRLPEAMVLRIFRDVLAALQAAHEKGIIHRDLKPGNILLMPDGGAKLADFGLVKLVDGQAGAEEKNRISTKDLPNTNRYMGTTAYMSPEQQDGSPLDARSDIYSLGLVIYELLVGHRPGLRMKLPYQMGLPVAAWWDDVLDRMLETRPADRPSSASELAAMLPGSVEEATAAQQAAREKAEKEAALARQAEDEKMAAVEQQRAEELAKARAEAERKRHEEMAQAEAARKAAERERVRLEAAAKAQAAPPRQGPTSGRSGGGSVTPPGKSTPPLPAAAPSKPAPSKKQAKPVLISLAVVALLSLIAWGVTKPVLISLAVVALLGLIAWGVTRQGNQGRDRHPGGPAGNVAHQEELQRERTNAHAAAQAKAAEREKQAYLGDNVRNSMAPVVAPAQRSNDSTFKMLADSLETIDPDLRAKTIGSMINLVHDGSERPQPARRREQWAQLCSLAKGRAEKEMIIRALVSNFTDDWALELLESFTNSEEDHIIDLAEKACACFRSRKSGEDKNE